MPSRRGERRADLVHLAETYIDQSATLSKDSAVKGGGRRAARVRPSTTTGDPTPAPPAAAGPKATTVSAKSAARLV
jgi:hypothetical protein